MTSYNPNDCAIVAIAHYLHLPYEDVLQAAEWDPMNGTMNAAWLMQQWGMRVQQLPRSWQEWQMVEGIALLFATAECKGHAAVLHKGRLHDADCPKGLPINDYLRKWKMVVWEVWH